MSENNLLRKIILTLFFTLYQFMKDVFVLSKQHAALFASDVTFAAISVSTYPGEWPKITENNRVDLLQLHFKDSEFATDSSVFNVNQANQILEFINQNWDKVDAFLVHCEAGLSRSPAIAAALTKIAGGDETFYFKNYSPNQLVYRTILESHYGKMA